jgi:purine-binding chemotaxis protein CheW
MRPVSVPSPPPADAADAVELEAADTVQLCAFWVGAQEYALDIMRVEEILQPLRGTPVPNAPDFVEGVVKVGGVIIPVVDVKRRLGGGSPPPRAKPKLLVCKIGTRRVGLRVDGVSQVVRVRRSEIKPAPRFTAGGAHPYLVGVWGPAERLRLLLDIKALVRPGEPS